MTQHAGAKRVKVTECEEPVLAMTWAEVGAQVMLDILKTILTAKEFWTTLGGAVRAGTGNLDRALSGISA